MRVLLLGHTGYLGSFLSSKLHTDVPVDRHTINTGRQYDYVINCIGKPDLVYCDLHENETNYANRDVLLDIRKHYPTSKVISFSSYYVYDDVGLCKEQANVTQAYAYTRQKLQAEKIITNLVSFRIGKLFGNVTRTQNKFTEYVVSNDCITTDFITFNPTSLQQVLDAIMYELETQELSGVYNLANGHTATHWEYACFINELMGTNKTIHAIDKVHTNFNNYGRFAMDCSKISNYISLTPWQNALEDYIKTLTTNKII